MKQSFARFPLKFLAQLAAPFAIANLMLGSIVYSASQLTLAIDGHQVWRPEDAALLGALGGFLGGLIFARPFRLKALPMWGFGFLALGVSLRVFFLEGHWWGQNRSPLVNFAAEMRGLAYPLLLPVFVAACGAVWVKWAERRVVDAAEQEKFAEKQRRRFYFGMILLLVVGHGILSVLESSGKIEWLETNWLGFPGWLWLLSVFLVYPIIHFARETTMSGSLIALIATAAVTASVLVHFVPYEKLVPFLPIGISVGLVMLGLMRLWSRQREGDELVSWGKFGQWGVWVLVPVGAWLFCETYHQRYWRSAGYSLASLNLARELRANECSSQDLYIRYRQPNGPSIFKNGYWLLRVDLLGPNREPVKLDLSDYDFPSLPVDRIDLRGLNPGDRVTLKNVKCNDIVASGTIDIQALPPFLKLTSRRGDLGRLKVEGGELEVNGVLRRLAPGMLSQYLKADPKCSYLAIHDYIPKAADFAQLRIHQQNNPQALIAVGSLKVDVTELGDEVLPTCLGFYSVEFYGGTQNERSCATWQYVLDGTSRYLNSLPQHLSGEEQDIAVVATNLIARYPAPVAALTLDLSPEELARELTRRKWTYEFDPETGGVESVMVPSLEAFEAVCKIPELRTVSLDETWVPWISQPPPFRRPVIAPGFTLGLEKDRQVSAALANSNIESLYFSYVRHFKITEQIASLRFLQIAHRQLAEIDPEYLPNLESIVLLDPDWNQFAFPRFTNLKKVTILLSFARSLTVTGAELRTKMKLPPEVELEIKTFNAFGEEAKLRTPEAWKRHREQLREQLRKKYLDE